MTAREFLKAQIELYHLAARLGVFYEADMEQHGKLAATAIQKIGGLASIW